MLQELVIRTNRLEHIEVAAFCGLNQLLVLMLGNNKLSSGPHLCSMRSSLEILDLDENKITTISKNYFKGFKKLRKIILSNNDIIHLPDLHWIQHSVSMIKVADNRLTSLDAFQTIGMFKHLSRIFMDNNNIRRFNVTLLRHMPKLNNLELYDNEITHVGDFRGFYDKKINLNGNQWHCGAALSWMGEENLEFERNLVCATPFCLRDMAIAEMSKLSKTHKLNILKLRQNGQHFLDEIYKFICLCKNCCILIRIALKFFPDVLINNRMTWHWHWIGGTLSDPMAQAKFTVTYFALLIYFIYLIIFVGVEVVMVVVVLNFYAHLSQLLAIQFY